MKPQNDPTPAAHEPALPQQPVLGVACVRQIEALRPAASQEFDAALAAGHATYNHPLPLFNELGRLNRMLYTGRRPGTASGSATGG